MIIDIYEALELRKTQIKAVEGLANGKILNGDVGSGKSRVAVAYYMKKEAPKNVYVITTARKRDEFDWQQEFYRAGVGPATGPSGPEEIYPGARTTDGGVPCETEQGLGELPHGGSASAREEHAGSHGDDVDGDEAPSRAAGFHIGSRRVASDGNASGAGSPEEPSDRLNVGVGDSDVASARGFDAGHFPWVLTVDSWNNLGKYADVAGAFFIFDEQRLVGSGKWARQFLRIAKRNTWILLTATPGDNWMDYIPVFVGNNFYKNRTEFIREHVVYNNFTKFPKVDRYIGQGKLYRLRSSLLVDVPIERTTHRNYIPVILPFDAEKLDEVLKKRWNVYEDRPLRDVGEMFMVARKVVNSDPSRLEKVYDLWQKHPRLIVFYNFDYELMSLRSISESIPDGIITSPAVVPNGSDRSRTPSTSILGKSSISSGLTQTDSGLYLANTGRGKSSALVSDIALSSSGRNDSRQKPTAIEGLHIPDGSRLESSTEKPITSSSTSALAEWNGHKHQPVPNTDRWIYLVQYTAGSEAWNCITTDAMILYSRNYSWKVTAQSYGRIDRMNTLFRELYYYLFSSDSWVDRAIERSLRGKETFNVRRYSKLMEG